MPERLRVCKECGSIKQIKDFGLRNDKYIRYNCKPCYAKKRKRYNKKAYQVRKTKLLNE